MSNIGTHIVIGPRNNYHAFLTTVKDAGSYVAVVKGVDDFGACDEAKKVDPRTLTIGRINEVNGHDMQAWEVRNHPSPQAAAEAYLNMVLPRWRLNPFIDVWETFNEYSANWSWQADFYIRLIELCEPLGISLGLWSCSGGNPPLPGLAAVENKRVGVMTDKRALIETELVTTETPWEAVARACRRAKISSVKHYLCLHEYAWEGLLVNSWGNGVVGRYESIDRYLVSVDSELDILITECGQNGGGGFVGVVPFVGDCSFYDHQTFSTPRVKGVTMWTLGRWSGANFQDALPALAEYIKNNPNPVVPPDPEPEPDVRTYERVCHLLPQSATYDQVLKVTFMAYPKRETILFSIDDAFVRPVECTARTVHVWHIDMFPEFHGSAAELEAWVTKYYSPLPTIQYHAQWPGVV